jgi:hypothetical protein
MADESFCRPVINSTKKTYLAIGIVVGAAVTFAAAWFMGWLTF